jgi:hypothetical protein
MSEERPAIARVIASALFRDLSGFQGYPKAGPGEDHFIRAFQACVISVDHARAVIASFTGKMPTIQEIRDSAYSLREKFEVTEDQRIAWEREYGKPQPFKIDVKQPGEPPDAALWRQIIKRIGDPAKVQRTSWAKLAEFADEFGYPEYAAAWRRSAGA